MGREVGPRTPEPGREARYPVPIAAHERPERLEYLLFDLGHLVFELDYWVEENDVYARKAVAKEIAEEIGEHDHLSGLDIAARVRVDCVVDAPLAPAANFALAGDRGHGGSDGGHELVVHLNDLSSDYCR